MTDHSQVGVVDYGVGNLGSVLNMLRHIGCEPVLVNSAEAAAGVDRLILPGIGAYDAGISGLEHSGLADVVRSHAEAGRPLLGICLGMQLLLDGSAEGELPGLGLIPGRCTAFAEHVTDLRIPHMGWKEITVTKSASAAGFAFPAQSRFYFAHSYFFPHNGSEVVYAQASYGVGFGAAIGRGSVIGMQFHPEKSHRYGMAVLAEFARWCP